jgi:hypothetical protein
VFSEVSSVSARDSDEPGDCGWEVFMAVEVEAVGDKGTGDTTMVDIQTLLESIYTYC